MNLKNNINIIKIIFAKSWVMFVALATNACLPDTVIDPAVTPVAVVATAHWLFCGVPEAINCNSSGPEKTLIYVPVLLYALVVGLPVIETLIDALSLLSNTLGAASPSSIIGTDCESNKVFRMKGQGLTDDETGAVGDLYLKIVPKIPKYISNEEKDILLKLRETTNFSWYL